MDKRDIKVQCEAIVFWIRYSTLTHVHYESLQMEIANMIVCKCDKVYNMKCHKIYNMKCHKKVFLWKSAVEAYVKVVLYKTTKGLTFIKALIRENAYKYVICLNKNYI